MARPKQRDLVAGDACYLLKDALLYEVEIAEARVILEGDPLEFRMYRVKSREAITWFEQDSHHRSDLFAIGEETDQLIVEIERRVQSLEDLLRDLGRD